MNNFLVFQSDFGLNDAAVGEMEGVCFKVNPNINIRHLTHEISEFNIFEASYRLFQTIDYWPIGTTFVSIVDPGVGSDRLSVVCKTKSGQYIVTPNNGTLSHVNKYIGIEELRVIDESINRLSGSNESYTFHGRDVYAYTGARLASNAITFEEVGPIVSFDKLETFDIYESVINGDTISGQIDMLDGRFGSLWTSIPINDFKKLDFKLNDMINFSIYKDNELVNSGNALYGHSFADVKIGEIIIYMNSLNHIAIGINQGNFSKTYGIGVGSEWKVTFGK